MQSRGRRSSERGNPGRARWRRLVRSWARSGLSQAEFCRRHSLWASDFSLWKRHLQGHGGTRRVGGKTDRRPQKRLRWVPVAIGSRPASAADGREVSMGRSDSVAIVLRNGRQIHLAEGFDLEKLIRLVAALETA